MRGNPWKATYSFLDFLYEFALVLVFVKFKIRYTAIQRLNLALIRKSVERAVGVCQRIPVTFISSDFSHGALLSVNLNASPQSAKRPSSKSSMPGHTLTASCLGKGKGRVETDVAFPSLVTGQLFSRRPRALILRQFGPGPRAVDWRQSYLAPSLSRS